MLQVSYQAVEMSGYFQRAELGREAGCFIGLCLCDYENNVACHPAGAFTATGNLQGFVSGKVSHFFGWTGPALTINTACSSSLVAVHQACRAIQSGECEAALGGRNTHHDFGRVVPEPGGRFVPEPDGAVQAVRCPRRWLLSGRRGRRSLPEEHEPRHCGRGSNSRCHRRHSGPAKPELYAGVCPQPALTESSLQNGRSSGPRETVADLRRGSPRHRDSGGRPGRIRQHPVRPSEGRPGAGPERGR